MPFEVWFTDLHHFFFVFARIFGLIIGMPFLSQIEVSSRFRAIACIAITLVFSPLVPDEYFSISKNLSWSLCRFIGEFCIGFFLGLIARFALAAVDFAGQLIGFSAGISSATVFNPNQSNHGSVVSVLLTTAAITSFLLLDGHHMLFKNLLVSYSKLPANWFSFQSPLVHDFFRGTIDLTNMLVKTGFQLSIPFILVNTVLQFALGILGKLVPQIQVFFLGMSLQVLLGWFVLLITFGSILLFYEKINTSAYSIMGFAYG